MTVPCKNHEDWPICWECCESPTPRLYDPELSESNKCNWCRNKSTIGWVFASTEEVKQRESHVQFRGVEVTLQYGGSIVPFRGSFSLRFITSSGASQVIDLMKVYYPKVLKLASYGERIQNKTLISLRGYWNLGEFYPCVYVINCYYYDDLTIKKVRFRGGVCLSRRRKEPPQLLIDKISEYASKKSR